MTEVSTRYFKDYKNIQFSDNKRTSEFIAKVLLTN